MKNFILILMILAAPAYADDFAFINKTVTPVSLFANNARCTQPVNPKSAVLYVANYMVELCSDNPSACEITVYHSEDCSGDAIASAKLVDGKLMEINNVSQGYYAYGNNEENILSIANQNK